MIQKLTEIYIDHSTPSAFSFSFYCDRCGNEWRSGTVPFSKGGFSEVESDETIKLLWADEHRAAFQRANQEAMLHFNFCHECNRWVCDDCFYLSEYEHTDICIDCLNEEEV
jgi:hypothetical protein